MRRNSFPNRSFAKIAFVCSLLLRSPQFPAPADEADPKFQQELFHVRFPIHIRREASIHDSSGTKQDEWTQKAFLAPLVKRRFSILREPVFDVADHLRESGMVIPKGAHALFSPNDELLFISSTSEDLELAKVLLSPWPDDWRELISFDVHVAVTRGKKLERSVLNAESLGFVSGQRITIDVKGETNLSLGIEPVVGPDPLGDIFDLSVEATVAAAGKSIHVSHTYLIALSKGFSTTLGKLGDKSIIITFRFHKYRNFVGPDPTETPEKKAEAIGKIEAELLQAK